MKRGDHLTLSTVRATLHLGAHADGPNHFGRDARGIDEQDITTYLGLCQVVHVAVCRGERVGLRHLTKPVEAPRVLFRTATYPDRSTFTYDFAAFDPALVRYLALQGVRLIGIDTPSVDLFDSKDLPSHLACLECDVAILEGLVLDDVMEGHYELIALPLRIVGGDASPVRAVLRDLGEGART